MSRKRRKILLILVAVLPIVVVVQTVRSYVNRRKIPGIYLADGGVRCIVIRSTPAREMIVETNYLNPISEYRVIISSAGRSLTLKGKKEYGFSEMFELEASRSRRGDWDWVATGAAPAAGLTWVRKNRFEQILDWLFPSRFWRELLKRPVPFLHRLDDSSVVEYFDRQYTQERSREAFQIAKSLLGNHPDDPYVRSLYLDAAARINDTTEVAHRLEEWKPDFGSSGDRILSRIYMEKQIWLRSRRLTTAGRNGYDFCVEFFGDKTDLPTRLRVFPGIMDMDAFLPDRLGALGPPANVSFMDINIAAKVFRVLGVLYMFEGKRNERLTLLAATYRLAQLMTDSEYLVDSLIGAGTKRYGIDGLEVYAMNCCENEEEFKQLWMMLDRLERKQKPGKGKDHWPSESTTSEYMPDHSLPWGFYEVETRMRVADSRFELVRMATAAKYRLVTQGAFPKSNEEFAPLLPQGPPKDPFSDGPLKFLSSTDSLICYSIGPDKKDDRATIEYDPMNGTTSAGDISVKVPRRRRYPFARNGVRAASVEDLLRQFPNGLPPDPFATTKGKGFGTTTTPEGDVCIYSYGPNVDEFKSPQPHVLEVQYDPTNGITSAGDLFIRIPRP